MAIKYDREFNQYIQRVVSNFNRKVDRLEKQGKELLPDKVYVADLKAQYDKRYELKRKLNELQRFSNQGVEEVIRTEGGIKTTKYALENAKREIRRAKYVTTKDINRMAAKSTPLTITRNSALNLAKARRELLSKDIELVSKRQLESMLSNVNRILDYDKKSEEYQQNFFQVLFSEASYSGVDQSILDSIQNNLSQLSAQDLVKLTRENSNIKAIMDYSPTEGTYISQERMRDILIALEEQIPQIIKEYKS